VTDATQAAPVEGAAFSFRGPVPQSVALLGLGPSLDAYTGIVKRAGGRRAVYDETWCINGLGDTFACDRIWHMDDVRIQELRAAAKPDSNIAAMLKWMKTHPGPIYTSRAHPDYPGLVEFPLAEAIATFRHPYFNSTAAYAVAFAMLIGVKKLAIFGFDFTYANAHHAEQGRACVEFWLGRATELGMSIAIPKVSSLMDQCNTQEQRLYGYDSEAIEFEWQGQELHLNRTPREVLPTAEEIEARYDHTAHPNPLVSGSIAP